MVGIAFLLLSPSGLEVKLGWLKGQFCIEPESFAQIRKELPEFPANFDLKREMREKAGDLLSIVHSRYAKKPSLEDLYRIVYLGELDPDSFRVAAASNQPKIYEELAKYDRLPSDMVKRLFFATSSLSDNPYDFDFAEMMLSRYGYEEKIRFGYLRRICYGGRIDPRVYLKSRGIAFQLCARYPKSEWILLNTAEFLMNSIVSSKASVEMIDDALRGIDELEPIYRKSGYLDPNKKVFMKEVKETAKRQRAKLLAKEKGGG